MAKGWRNGLCENATIIYDTGAKRGFGGYPIKALKYCTRAAVIDTGGPRNPRFLCQECDAGTAQHVRGLLFSRCPNL